MLRDALVDQLMKRLGNITNTSLQSDIITEMVHVQATVLEGDSFKPWFLISEETSSQTIAGDERVLLPADWIAMWEYGQLHRYDSTLDDPYVEMSREDWDEISECLNYAGTPTHWDMAGQYLLMRPVADAIYPLRWWYYRKGLTLAGDYGTNNIENNWLKWAADWMLGEVGAIIAEQYLQYDNKRVAPFEKQAIRGRERVRILNITHEEALKRRIME